ncbi:hypothetical protein G0Q06_05180 [Puniceicoccales bacterium CK1056]|uniref:SH3 domain-containing protein n=1 Tax=Oceanipulchritudo coccoides TaxID=2706888 RepID=A0A6B2M195_9BACT|nr:SH3 domain-containing protein [Oceanipulchritudo coccoides]NDV61837.1 hypothetical protein [Oceanipulchritudo coccoides]
MQFRVLADYEVNDPHPLRLLAGTEVKAIKTDNSWPGWLWIESDGQSGWIPESYLAESPDGRLRTSREFNGTELSALRHAILNALETESGWIFARSESGETGWFPMFNLRPHQNT